MKRTEPRCPKFRHHKIFASRKILVAATDTRAGLDTYADILPRDRRSQIEHRSIIAVEVIFYVQAGKRRRITRICRKCEILSGRDRNRRPQLKRILDLVHGDVDTFRGVMRRIEIVGVHHTPLIHVVYGIVRIRRIKKTYVEADSHHAGNGPLVQHIGMDICKRHGPIAFCALAGTIHTRILIRQLYLIRHIADINVVFTRLLVRTELKEIIIILRYSRCGYAQRRHGQKQKSLHKTEIIIKHSEYHTEAAGLHYAPCPNPIRQIPYACASTQN